MKKVIFAILAMALRMDLVYILGARDTVLALNENSLLRYPWTLNDAISTQRLITQGWNGTFSHNTPKAQYAVDFGYPGDPQWAVMAASQGSATCTELDPTLGNYVTISHVLRSVYGNVTSVYAHLQTCEFTETITLWQGDWVGTAASTGISTANHLHFAEWNVHGNSVKFCISGKCDFEDSTNRGTLVTTDNARIGFDSAGNMFESIRNGYGANGTWETVGSTAAIGVLSSPCRVAVGGPTLPTPWVYGCSDGGYSGVVQTFYGPANKQRAIMYYDGNPTGFLLYRGILGAYTFIWNGFDWVHWMGYPIGNRVKTGVSPDTYRQDFQNGHIIYTPSACKADMYVAGQYKTTYTNLLAVCD